MQQLNWLEIVGIVALTMLGLLVLFVVCSTLKRWWPSIKGWLQGYKAERKRRLARERDEAEERKKRLLLARTIKVLTEFNFSADSIISAVVVFAGPDGCLRRSLPQDFLCQNIRVDAPHREHYQVEVKYTDSQKVHETILTRLWTGQSVPSTWGTVEKSNRFIVIQESARGKENRIRLTLAKEGDVPDRLTEVALGIFKEYRTADAFRLALCESLMTKQVVSALSVQEENPQALVDLWKRNTWRRFELGGIIVEFE